MIYRVGNIKTDWDTLVYPNEERFGLWLEEFSKVPNINNYDVWLCGKFLQGIKTTDIDIILTKQPESLSELKKILMKGIKLGFKYNILIDIQHADKEPINHNETTTKIVYGKKVIKGDEVLSDLTDEQEIYKDLYSYQNTYEKEYEVKPIKLNNEES